MGRKDRTAEQMEEWAARELKKVDDNGDGVLSFDEFKQWLQSGQSRFGPSGEVAEWRREVALRADAEADAAADAFDRREQRLDLDHLLGGRYEADGSRV